MSIDRYNQARALYSDAPIVLMDDCLSAVDAPVAEHLFNKAILRFLKGRTRCVVACVCVVRQERLLLAVCGAWHGHAHQKEKEEARPLSLTHTTPHHTSHSIQPASS